MATPAAVSKALRAASPFLAVFLAFGPAQAAPGIEGAAFLNIPLGGRPAALGSAYTALAADSYAPLYNPAGLGFARSFEFSASHLAYLDSIRYQNLGFLAPLGPNRSLALSIQSLASGDIPHTDVSGQRLGSYSTRYSAYSLAYGAALTPRLSMGATLKLLQAKIQSLSASAYAADFGALYRHSDTLSLAAVVSNLGSQLKFIRDGDDLPMALRLGAAYRFARPLTLALETAYRRSGLPSAHVGLEYRPLPMFSLRAGLRTDTLKGLSPMAGLTAGVGLHLARQEFSYAWLPMGQLGNTQHFSIVLRFGQAPRPGGSRSARAWQRVAFSYDDERAQGVLLSGDFNGWNPEPMERDARGRWTRALELRPGAYRYNFIVDGVEKLDPANTQVELNGWRSESSVLRLQAQAGLVPGVSWELGQPGGEGR